MGILGPLLGHFGVLRAYFGPFGGFCWLVLPVSSIQTFIMWAPCISLLNMFQLLSCELLGLLKMWVFVHWDGLFTELQATKWWKPWLGGVGFEGWGWVPSFYFSFPSPAFPSKAMLRPMLAPCWARKMSNKKNEMLGIYVWAFWGLCWAILGF